MKKIVSLILVFVLVISSVLALSGCKKNSEASFKVALITDGAPINDRGYNQSAWNGVKAFSEENDLSCIYYQPSLNGEEDNKVIANYIELAVKNGAEMIVLPGEKFAVAAYETAPIYQDVKFILIEALPHSQDDETPRFQSNVESVKFNKAQAGFLAGYTAVTSGLKDAKGKLTREFNTKLGYLGSINEQDSADYGGGFVQGAAYAADTNSIPVYMDYAEYDNPFLTYDYSFTVEPVYIKREEADKKTFKVTVVDGIGTGVYTDGENVTITANPAPEGKRFDHWEVKSDTDGVKNKKVNISSKKDSSMNLLVGDCDCTITAVWTDAETVPVYITEEDGATQHEVINAEKISEVWITAPAAQSGTVFNKWITNDESLVADINSKETKVNVTDSSITLTPSYKPSETPTFDVTVKDGTGSGSYVAGDTVKLVADAPQEGYMFYKWENVDSQGDATGIAMENEYCYHTTFEMIDRYASVVEKMYDGGAQIVFAGGNPISDSIFSAASVFDYQVFGYGYGIEEGSKGNCFASVVNDYGQAVKLALSDFKGATIFSANCANNCIYVTGKSVNEYRLEADGSRKKDKKGNELKDDNYDSGYALVYGALADGKIKIKNIQKGGDVRNLVNTDCLTVNYWVEY